MKLTGLGQVLPLINRVQEKHDDDKGKSQQDFHDQMQRQKQGQKERAPESPEEVRKAVDEFVQGGAAQAQGLTADLVEPSGESTGLGLKVILKDGTGAVIRQLSGEEFLRLRESAQAEGSNRGKLLDKKL